MALRFAPTACASPPSISKKTVLAMFEAETGTRIWLDSLSDNQWTITSFDPDSRVVCIDLLSDSGIEHHVALTLPFLSSSKV